MRLTEKEFEQLINKKNKNHNLKRTGFTRSNTIKNALDSIKEANLYKFKKTENSFSFIIFGAKLISLNSIFSFLQNPAYKYQVFNYKKKWNTLIQNILRDAQQTIGLPKFNNKVKITLFRRSPRPVDDDALSGMFKFVIDGIKKNNKNNNLFLINDDDRDNISEIVYFNQIGEHAVGIIVEQTDDNKGLINEDLFY